MRTGVYVTFLIIYKVNVLEKLHLTCLVPMYHLEPQLASDLFLFNSFGSVSKDVGCYNLSLKEPHDGNLAQGKHKLGFIKLKESYTRVYHTKACKCGKN